jgi:putative phage-type endonuclease
LTEVNVIDTSNMTRDQVFALRGYGASETAGIAGLGYKNQTRYKIWLRKTSGAQKEFDEETQNLFWWGNALEPLIAQRFTLETGLEFAANQVLVQHPTYPWMTALIDGVTTSEEIVDYKAMTFFSSCDLEEGDPSALQPKHVIQANHQMAVCEQDHAHWACFAGGDLKLKKFVIQRDDELVGTIIQLVREFKEHVDSGTPPAEFEAADVAVLKKQFKAVTEDAIELPELGDIVLRYSEAKEAEAYAKNQKEQCQAFMLAAMKEAGAATVGNYVLTRKQRTRAGYPVKPSEYVEFSCKLKKEIKKR